MATPHPAGRKLRELMGEEAGNSMVDWLDNMDAHYSALRAETRADFAELRHEMQVGFAKCEARFEKLEAADQRLEQKIQTAGQRLDEKIDAATATLRAEMQAGFASVRQNVAEQLATTLKWGIGLWITSLATTVGVLGFLRLR